MSKCGIVLFRMNAHRTSLITSKLKMIGKDFKLAFKSAAIDCLTSQNGCFHIRG